MERALSATQLSRRGKSGKYLDFKKMHSEEYKKSAVFHVVFNALF
jgi:hypothetical protein